MRKSSHTDSIHLTQPPSRQQVFLHVVVSSLVLCAALTPPSAAQVISASPLGQDNSQQSTLHAEQSPFLTLSDLSFLHRRLKYIKRKIKDRELDFNSAASSIDVDIYNGKVKDGTYTETFVSGDKWYKVIEDFIQTLDAVGLLKRTEDARHLKVSLESLPPSVTATALLTYDEESRTTQMAETFRQFLSSMQGLVHDADESAILSNMRVSASGKQLSLKLEMSREQAGNLLRQHLSIP